ncbi:hypothetical protein Cob_v002077 [Colletotrichum orbiculare MAFF 240422]|uniref:Jacalin-type lectin domain-containing protein n=1 Tax=Colletotrichum orbiculare (strain 104-T / ATCC 96160 / CBS 514.97 / LARS 414 / MAFF 240422) TaxID=1213857 RepID=A0A484G333_COLOR|nr:hypothetical protein Cob_v002077 [Colletotrichum orbiculare MAFF 240422]
MAATGIAFVELFPDGDDDLCRTWIEYLAENGPLQPYKGKALGLSSTEGSVGQEVVFESSVKQNRVLSRIVFYHGNAVQGIEFVYDDDTTQLFGKRGLNQGGDTFDFDLRRGEYISGFFKVAHLRKLTWWICSYTDTPKGIHHLWRGRFLRPLD